MYVKILFFFTVFSSHHTDVCRGVRGKQLTASFFGSASWSSGFKRHHHLNMVVHHMGLVCIPWEELKQPAEEVSENTAVLLEETVPSVNVPSVNVPSIKDQWPLWIIFSRTLWYLERVDTGRRNISAGETHQRTWVQVSQCVWWTLKNPTHSHGPVYVRVMLCEKAVVIWSTTNRKRRRRSSDVQEMTFNLFQQQENGWRWM